MDAVSQQKILEVDKGLFLIKYESSESTDSPPRVAIAAEPGSENAVELIIPPDAEQPILWSPGASVVARAKQKCRLRVIVTAAEPNGSTAAKVQVLPLSVDPEGVKSRQRAAAQLDLSEFRVVGHVAGRGDVTADADNWVAGPLAPSRIEGIAIQWPGKPRDLVLRYAVTVGGSRPIMGQFAEAGAFAGTKGNALPLVGVTIEIDGVAAYGRQLAVESIFLGSPPTKIVGRRVVLAGPTGREPLVGLRVRVEPEDDPQALRPTSRAAVTGQHNNLAAKNNVQRDEPAPANTAVRSAKGTTEADRDSPAKPSRGKRGTVRVFRSSSRAKQLQPSG
jgi:hypothetical protein